MAEHLQPALERAMRDLADIKSLIAKVEQQEATESSERSSAAQIKLHLIVVALTVLAIVVFWFNRLRWGFVVNRVHETLFWRIALISVLLTFLILLTLALFLALRQILRKEGELVEDYLFRNFKYLRGVSLASDVIVKFTAVSVAILAGRADWVSPLLLIFTGDYLLQGRFFALPIRLSFLLGFILILFGLVYLLFLYGTLLYAFVPFLIVTLLSLSYLLKSSYSSPTSSEVTE